MGSTPEEKSAWRGLIHSRKAVFFAVIMFVIAAGATGFLFLLLRAGYRGDMPLKDAFALFTGTFISSLLTVGVMAWKVIDSIKEEDVAKINADARQNDPPGYE